MRWSRCGLAVLVLGAGGLIGSTTWAAAQSSTQPSSGAPRPTPASRPPASAGSHQGQGAQGAPAQAPVAPPAAAPAAAPAAPVPPRFVIVLDAAHGGDDTGGHLSSGQLEKNANLALSVRLRSLLGARGFQVVTTRESDQSVDLNRRAEIANHAEARACISLHAADTGSGAHLFVSSLTPALPSRFAAWKTAQAAWVTRSLALAGVLNAALLHAGTNVTLGRTPLPGIESMTCPAVAIELGPARDSDHKVTSEPDDANYQAQVAQTLATALLEWKSQAWRPEGARSDSGSTEGRQR